MSCLFCSACIGANVALNPSDSRNVSMCFKGSKMIKNMMNYMKALTFILMNKKSLYSNINIISDPKGQSEAIDMFLGVRESQSST